MTRMKARTIAAAVTLCVNYGVPTSLYRSFLDRRTPLAKAIQRNRSATLTQDAAEAAHAVSGATIGFKRMAEIETGILVHRDDTLAAIEVGSES